jgi:glycosyltransferase involved in cell wall biosynthesis
METKFDVPAAALVMVDCVRFTGYQVDKQPYCKVMDVLVLASAREAFGLVLVEAMFAGLPVVGTRVSGIPSVVRDVETGHLGQPLEPEHLAAAILGLINEPETAKVMGEKGRVRARSEFRAERYLSDIDRPYRRLGSERGLV